MTERANSWRFWLVLSYLAAVIPHMEHLPWWALVYFGTALAAFPYVTGKGLRKTGRWTVRFLALVLFSFTVVYFQGTIGRDAGTALLVGLLGLKMMELGTERDKKLFCLLNYFLVLTTVLYFHSLPAALYMLCIALANSMALVRSVHSKGSWQTDLRRVLVILLQALPLAIVLFIFFPRMPGSLFGVQESSSQGISGLSDFLAPGEISSLAISDDPVFRVSFSGEIPEVENRYWRCMVFGDYDGVVWKRFPKCPEKENLLKSGEKLRYQITLEGHNRKWLPVLGVPLEWSANTRSGCAATLRSRKKVVRRKRVSVLSDPDAEVRGGNWERCLQLPNAGNPRARSMAREWKNLPREKRIARALDYFRNNDFVYTLRPGVMHGNYIDKFLFDTQKGFCEHYAAAFAFLMRAAGVPSRVVVGYQGGEPNPLGEYLLIREKHAHAWTEVYVEKKGWERIDPVAMVSPERLEMGLKALNPRAGEGLASQTMEKALHWWSRVSMAWDAMNNVWNQWVLDYTHKKQGRIFARLELDNSSVFGVLKIGMAVVGAAIFSFLSGWFLRRLFSRKTKDPLAESFELFCSKMSRVGIDRPVYLGPLDYLEFIEKKFAGQCPQARYILDMYVRIRYQDKEDLLPVFCKEVKKFDPRKAC